MKASKELQQKYLITDLITFQISSTSTTRKPPTRSIISCPRPSSPTGWVRRAFADHSAWIWWPLRASTKRNISSKLATETSNISGSFRTSAEFWMRRMERRIGFGLRRIRKLILGWHSTTSRPRTARIIACNSWRGSLSSPWDGRIASEANNKSLCVKGKSSSPERKIRFGSG